MVPETPNPRTLQSQIKKLLAYPLTQLGMSERFISEHGADVHYCEAWKSWLVWDGARWELDTTSAINRRLHTTIRALGSQAQRLYREVLRSIADEDVKAGMTKTIREVIYHARHSEEQNQITAILAIATTLAGVPITPAGMDARPMLLNCRNGVVDLATGELVPHADRRVREWLLTKMAPVEYDPRAGCPRWMQFLDEVFAGDATKISYMQKSIGYTLTGAVTEKAMFFFHGGGNNGKTTLLEIIRSVFGDYAGTIDIDTLMKDRTDDYSLRMIATMHGKRLVTASEASENSRLNEALIKRLTGMNQLVGRPIYGKSFTFEPEFKLYIDANHRPTIRGTDDAIWIRMRLIPFDVQFSKDQIDKDLWRKLRAELPGILAWAVAGCLAWQRDGLETPASITKAVASYRSEQDLVGEFLADRTDPDPIAIIPAKDLYTDFRTWCTDAGERDIPKQRWFTDRVQERYKMDHKRDGNCFLGMRLRSKIATAEWYTTAVPAEDIQ